MSPLGELEERLCHLDKAGFVSRVLETRSERHALGGIRRYSSAVDKRAPPPELNSKSRV